jgi:hypothetical protein
MDNVQHSALHWCRYAKFDWEYSVTDSSKDVKMVIYLDTAYRHNSRRGQSCIQASRAECLLFPAYRPGPEWPLPLWIPQRKKIWLWESGGPLERNHWDLQWSRLRSVANCLWILDTLAEVNNQAWGEVLHEEKKKTRDASSRPAEKTGGYELMDPL